MSTNNEAGERMTLPKAISDAIDAYGREVDQHYRQHEDALAARAALERAVAEAIACAGDEKIAAWRKAAAEGVRLERIAPVDAPTEAEIEAWEKEARANDVSVLPDTHPGEFYQVRGRCIEQAVALMRRAAAATRPWNGGPTVTALMRGVEDAAIEWGKCVGDFNAACQAAPPPSGLKASEAVREAGHKCEIAYGYFQKAIKALADHRATPAPSALERLRERVDRAAAVENIEMGEWRAFDRVLDWIDEEREREAGHG